MLRASLKVPFRPHLSSLAALLALSHLLAGCSQSPVEFAPHRLMTARMSSELRTDLQPIQEQTQEALTYLFGTPDEPKVPIVLAEHPESSFRELLDNDLLEIAAGPFGRDHSRRETGLYRKHCVQCHGLTGDGYGPAAALLNPYPRDFRRGTFKWKKSLAGERPTLDDLRQTIEHGIPGTSMPALPIRSVSDDDNQDEPAILAHYVRYLAMRGEVERQLMMSLAPQLDFDEAEPLFDLQSKETDSKVFDAQLKAIENCVLTVAKKWTEPKLVAELHTTESPEPEQKVDVRKPKTEAELQAFLTSAKRGQRLFQSELGACSQCHGPLGKGDGKVVDFDEWTKDWTIRAGVDPKNPLQWKPLKKLGLLKPVPVQPRNFQWGVYRGGSSPEEIFDTLSHGIDGTPMPAAPREPIVKNGFTDSQLWDLVNFCQAIGLSEYRQTLEAEAQPDAGR
jgi:cytochrome c553